MKKEKKEIIALILAGGQGSRLKSLPKSNAKPAVEFGGKYRIIDFTLSNCANSAIDVIGVLTQYQPLILNSHIGIGIPWDLDRAHGGVTILPPYMSDAGGSWYKGTADAVLQNLHFIEQYNPEYLLVLSGDHIYKMDYLEMLKYHRMKGADVTIAVTQVSIEDASRFGIMNTDDDLKIYEFEEKPAKPKSTLASMGIYIFKWNKLKKMLLEDAKIENSSHDFGKNIIPMMLKNKFKLYAFLFKGYWKDVGTIDSYWGASMDLLKDDTKINTENLDLFDDNWKIYGSPLAYPAQYIGSDASIKNSLIVEGCIVMGDVDNSVLSYGVNIGHDAEVKNSVLMSDVVVEDGAHIINSIICSKAKIKKGSIVGGNKKITVVSENKTVDGEYKNE